MPSRRFEPGLELCQAVKGLAPNGGLTMSCRVGIATGLVIADDAAGAGGSESGIFGEALTIAGRLQGHAQPDTVVIEPTTRKLIGSFFDCRKLGPIDAPAGERPRRRGRCWRQAWSTAGFRLSAETLQRRWLVARRSSTYSSGAGPRLATARGGLCCLRASRASASRASPRRCKSMRKPTCTRGCVIPARHITPIVRFTRSSANWSTSFNSSPATRPSKNGRSCPRWRRLLAR